MAILRRNGVSAVSSSGLFISFGWNVLWYCSAYVCVCPVGCHEVQNPSVIGITVRIE